MKLVCSTDDQLANVGIDALGGKGHHLAKLTQAGFNVPPFCVINAAQIRTLHSFSNADDSTLIQLTADSPISEIKQLATRMQERIRTGGFNLELTEAIVVASNDFFQNGQTVSVRSSAISEDGANSSFAGQHETFLNVSQADLFDKIKECVASAWSVGALSYRLKHGIPTEEIEFAVVIQAMVNAQKSGVAFSMNTNGNLADAIIVAGFGLGEGIVSDQVECDEYRVTRQTKKIEKTILDKFYALEMSGENGIQRRELSEEKQSIPVLTDTEIMAVFEGVMKAEEHLGTIADIEFSFGENGALFFLQARPVTGVNLREIKLLDNTNIVESYPHISLPLTFSFARHAYEEAFRGASKAFWISDRMVNESCGMFADLLGYHQGRIYYRLDNWYKMITLVFSSKKSIQSWEKAVGLKRPTTSEIRLSFGSKLKVYATFLWLIINYKRGNRRFFKLFNACYEKLEATRLDALSTKELVETLDVASREFFHFWYLTLINDLMTFKSFDWVQKGIVKHKLGPSDVANDLICGFEPSESELSIVAVLKLKEEILANPALSELFSQDSEVSSKVIWQRLEAEEFGGFSKRVRAHIQRFGDRTLAELKLENPSFRRDPEKFIDLLKGQLTAKNNLETYRSQQAEIVASTQQLLKEKLKWWKPSSLRMKFAIRTAAYGTRNRENMRFCRTRIYGIVKDFYLEIGRKLAATSQLEAATDVFYLTREEINDHCTHGVKLDLFAIVSARKLEREFDENCVLPDRIIYTDEAPQFAPKKQAKMRDVHELEGIAVSKGIVRARAIVITEARYNLNVSGKILITRITDPGWVFLMSQAVGLISEKGSLLSHTAIVGRELGIPVVVSVEDVTQRIQTGDLIEMDGQRGTVKIIERA